MSRGNIYFETNNNVQCKTLNFVWGNKTFRDISYIKYVVCLGGVVKQDL